MADSSIGTIFRLEELNKPYAFDKVERKSKMFDIRKLQPLSLFAFLAVAMMLPTLVLPLTATAQENTPTNTPIPPTPTETATETPTDTPIDTPTAGFQTNTPPWPTKTPTTTGPTNTPTGTPTCDSGTTGDYLPHTPTMAPTISFLECLDMANYTGPFEEQPPCYFCWRPIPRDTPIHIPILNWNTKNHHLIKDISASHVINCQTCNPAARTVGFTSEKEIFCLGGGLSLGIVDIIKVVFNFTINNCWERPQETVSWDILLGPCERAKPYDTKYYSRVSYGYLNMQEYEYFPNWFIPCDQHSNDPTPTPNITAVPTISLISSVHCNVYDVFDPYIGKGGSFLSTQECTGKCCNWCTPTPMNIPFKP